MSALNVVLLLVCSIVLCTEAEDPIPATGDKKVVCYYTNWSSKRDAPYAFTPDKIDPFVCTHIIYAFADIGMRNNLISSDPDFDFAQHAYANITGLKKKNKNLKVMLGIGGWSKGSLGFGRITSNETNRSEFAKNAVRYIRGYMFDGLDLNWQHPTFREGGTPEDKENYVLLAQTLREEFNREAANKNKPRLLLSIAISHHQKFLPAYDIPNFNNYMDFISVICYDYHFSYEAAVNHHSPLYSLEEDSDYNYDANINVNYTINYFSELASPEKLVLGIPAYGRTYKLENPADTALGSYADGPGDQGPVTKEKGWFAYFEICNFVNNENWTVVQTKPGTAGPYAYKGDQWVCYDDIDMIRSKAAYANQKSLGGIMFWTMDYDDFLGNCQETTFPIIRAARDALIPEQGILFMDDSYNPKPAPVATTGASPVRVQPAAPRRSPTQRPRYTYTGAKPPAVQWSQQPDNYPVTPSAPQRTPPPITPSVSPRMEPDEDSDVSVPQSNIVADLIRLIEKAGGMKNFCKVIRQDKKSIHSSLVHMRELKNGDTNENSIVLESPNLPPILLVLSNSSVYIKEVNVYHRPAN